MSMAKRPPPPKKTEKILECPHCGCKQQNELDQKDGRPWCRNCGRGMRWVTKDKK